MPPSMTLGDRDPDHSPGRGRRARATRRTARPAGATPAQREQILAAAERLLEQAGPESLSAAEVSAAAGVERRVLLSIFPRPGQLQRALFDRVVSRLGEMMQRAFAGERVWIEAVRAALVQLLGFLDGHPQIARFLFVSSLQGDPPMLKRRQEVLAILACALESDCPEAKAQVASPFGAEAVLGGAASVLHGRLLEEPVPALNELMGPLMAVIVLPYLDASAAREEVSRSMPRAPTRHREGGAGAEALIPAGMRLTSRTAQVLQTLSRQPGISNSAIAQEVGIGDQGQTSRMLARLRRLKLVEDHPSPSARGTTKAWRLTAAGSRLLRELEPSGSAATDR
jgi:AcrR family transcriptional regulator